MYFARAFLLLVTLTGATGAAAGSDVCLVGETNEYVFVLKRFKPPKRPGDVVVVTGSANSPLFSNDTPVYGTLLWDSSSDARVLGLTLHYPRCLVGAVLDDTLYGNVTYDCNLDGAADGGAAQLVPVDCETPQPAPPSPSCGHPSPSPRPSPSRRGRRASGSSPP